MNTVILLRKLNILGGITEMGFGKNERTEKRGLRQQDIIFEMTNKKILAKSLAM
jgi:hypothetical protein